MIPISTLNLTEDGERTLKGKGEGLEMEIFVYMNMFLATFCVLPVVLGRSSDCVQFAFLTTPKGYGEGLHGA